MTDGPDLTLAAKAAATSGSGTWTTTPVPGVAPCLVLSDGPHGVRRQPDTGDSLGIGHSLPATCFPPAAGLGSSWNPALAEAVGRALGREARALGVQVLLGPGVNIKRSPLGGRNFEYFSEDPHLTGRMGAAVVRGVQAEGVAATPKHYAANNQETDRWRVSADVDERTLREIYLPAFEHIVRTARPWALMSAYNRVNGVFASESSWLLTDLLRDEWGFDGLVVSDWGAVDDRVAAIAAGLDLEMPPSGTDDRVEQAVRAGRLEESHLDRVLERLQRLAERVAATPDPHGAVGVDHDAHHRLARTAAHESVVLLKNDGGVLPLDPASGGRIAVIGEFARTPRFQGGGSSRVVPTRITSALDHMQSLATPHRDVVFAPGFRLDGTADPALVDEAVEAAAGASVAVLFLGLPTSEESEGFDRDHLLLPGVQLDLLAALDRVNTPVVVVLSNGAVVDVDGWQGGVDAIVEGWLLGQAGGEALAEILLGHAYPSGRLAETIPLRLRDTPSYLSFPGRDGHVRYAEGVHVGYRWYDARDADVAYPFGHGLGYTTFSYDALAVAHPAPGRWTVDVTVTNTGTREGAEVVQLYTGPLADDSIDRPVRELRGFAKLVLAPGRSERCTFELSARDLSTWDEAAHRWRVDPGDYHLDVGASSRDIRLTGTITVTQGAPAELTKYSTLGEWLRHPVGGELLRDVRAAAPPGTAPEMLRMAEQVPLVKLTTWGLGLSEDGIDAMVGEVALRSRRPARPAGRRGSPA
jgi:beta-glucosidase